MKKTLLLLAVVLLSASTALFARSNYRGNDRPQNQGPRFDELFEQPIQGQMSTLEGQVVLVNIGNREGKIPVLKTADAAYLLPPNRQLREGDQLIVDAYILQPKQDAELKGFDYEDQSILPALMVTMASDESGQQVYHRRARDMDGWDRGYHDQGRGPRDRGRGGRRG